MGGMQEPEVIRILKKTGAIKADDHFVGVSGAHFDTYIFKDALFPHTAETSRIGELFALRNRDLDIDVVAAPALGGIILSQWVAFHLSRLKEKEIASVYTEKTSENGQVFTRGYDEYVRGRNVLVVEDSTTTGGSAQKTAESVRAAGGKVIAVSVMINRDPALVTEATFGAPFRPLAEYPVRAYDPAECPLCKRGVPVNTAIGHGRKFLESQQK
jgi:orotate phosphoribosyltransferase